MNYLSVCSGIEAASVAWHPLGWTPIGFSEIEPFPSAVLAHHFPTVKNFGDMTKYEQWDIKRGSVDLLVGGTPCQSFSVAGLRQGLKDPRGNLMLTFLAIAEHFGPRWLVWENVPGVLSSNGGRDFGSFLGGLGELGYGFAYRVLDAQWVRTYGHPRAVPQRRRRVFLIGCFGDATRAAKVLFESESLQRYSAKGKASRQRFTANAEERTRSGGELKTIPDVTTVDARNNCDRGDSQHLDRLIPCWWDGGQVSQTIDAVVSKGQAMPEKNRFPAVLQPVPFVKAKRAQSTTDNETWVEGAVAPTQNAFDVGDTRATTAILSMPVDSASPTLTAKMQGSTGWAPYNETAHLVPVLFENHPNDSRVTGPHDVAPSCVSRYGTGGGNVPLVIPTMPQAMQAEGWRVGKENQDGRGNGLGVGKDGDPCPTLDRSAVHAVAYSFDSLASNSMKSNNPTSGCNVVDVAKCIDTTNPCPNKNQGGIAVAVAPISMRESGQGFWVKDDIAGTLPAEGENRPSRPSNVISQTMQVRRLTPTECERLQGFPDGWTAIPWKNKSANDCPDGPRYKALGNSMAVNCMEWLGERIKKFNNEE